MASDVRIGLLLGSVFILVIVCAVSDPRGLDDLSRIIITDPPGVKPEIQPGNLLPGHVPQRHHEETPLPGHKESSQNQPPVPMSPDEVDNHTEAANQAWPKVHIVREGENLADIAKAFYGPREGNRRANVKGIFEANSRLLESPDRIYPGQKLIIPRL